MQIEVEGEKFQVTVRTGPEGGQLYDFDWLNGPTGIQYGFTIGPSAPVPVEYPREFIEREARFFVEEFFSDGGIGPSDFPDFVDLRRRQGN